MDNEVSLETVLRSGQPLDITDIYQRDSLTYFKVNGIQFQTYGSHVHHKHSPMYDCQVTKIWASEEHVPEMIARKDKMMEDINDDLALWYKHRLSVFKITFIIACDILAKKGDDQFLKFIDEHFCITAEDGAEEIIERLEKE